ncbi:(Fe-S)-binding protein [Spirosoma oryzicola]|uniref:(Fe-S)-binding protein n=1 Tax=Spirosoma oryzicola TaxID=2898794 RepID=UPI001E457017|nr:(Fe-S)-binding protein [Spirosoma oryzicola]UHG92026.1 (Fe-S)-binding protein [Spirosoma oryzicola]
MNVGLFIPCYVDQFYPQVGIATLRLLESLGVRVVFPMEQTCCGQPMANSGFQRLSAGCDKNFIRNFANCDVVVGPSGSCVLHLKEHLHSDDQPEEAARLRNNVYELCEFLTDVLKVEQLPKARFPYRVGLHTSCHGQRGLRLSSMSERMEPKFSKPEQLLRLVDGLDLIQLSHPDECCGFGGTFCVFEEALSSKMGKDRVYDHVQHGAEVITGGDMSCLMQLEGVLHRQKSSVRVMHIAEILTAGN